MGAVRPGPAAKLFVASLIAQDGRTRVEEFDRALEKELGPIELAGPLWPFEYTDYYTAEMGPNLLRRIVGFRDLFDAANLAWAKLTTNRLEDQFTRQYRPSGGRIVNFDPGYLTLGQIVLATTKSYSHRIYLRDGIWGEVTLRYHQGRYEKWDWTYPDYAAPTYNMVWQRMRDRLKEQISPQAAADGC